MKPISRFTRKITKLSKWIPIIWRDEDWDYIYSLKLIQFKLEQMAELHIKEGNSMNSKLYASELLYASHLLTQAIEADDFNEEDTQEKIDVAFGYITKNITKWWD